MDDGQLISSLSFPPICQPTFRRGYFNVMRVDADLKPKGVTKSSMDQGNKGRGARWSGHLTYFSGQLYIRVI